MSEIFNSEEMRRFEYGQFLKKDSYSFMKKAGKRVLNSLAITSKIKNQ